MQLAGDLLAGQPFEVVHPQHVPFDRLQGGFDLLHQLTPVDGLDRRLLVVVRQGSQHVDLGRVFPIRIRQAARQAGDARAQREQLAQPALGDAEVLGEFGVGGLPVEQGAQTTGSLVPQPQTGAVEPRQVVHVAELVEHRAANPDPHERREAVPQLGPVVLDRLDQTPHARVGEILHIDGTRQTRAQGPRHLFDGALVALDQSIAEGNRRGASIPGEQRFVLFRVARLAAPAVGRGSLDDSHSAHPFASARIR